MGLGAQAGCATPSQNPASSAQTQTTRADAAGEARLTPSHLSGLFSFSGFTCSFESPSVGIPLEKN